MRLTPVAYKLEQSVMGQKMCFGDIYVIFGVRTKKLIIPLFFAKKTRNSLFPQCKTSVGNNSGFISERELKFMLFPAARHLGTDIFASWLATRPSGQADWPYVREWPGWAGSSDTVTSRLE